MPVFSVRFNDSTHRKTTRYVTAPTQHDAIRTVYPDSLNSPPTKSILHSHGHWEDEYCVNGEVVHVSRTG